MMRNKLNRNRGKISKCSLLFYFYLTLNHIINYYRVGGKIIKLNQQDRVYDHKNNNTTKCGEVNL